MEMSIERRPTRLTKRGPTTFGDWRIEGLLYCYTLEDEIREDPNPDTPQNEAKVYGETAFPPGRFELKFRNSPHFGPETIEVVGVPGYTDTLVHGGTDVKSTLGCVIVGDVIDEEAGTIAGAKARGVLAELKRRIRVALDGGARVWLTVKNPHPDFVETSPGLERP